jgi:hypothetical protein
MAFSMIALYVDDVHVAYDNTKWRMDFTAQIRSRVDRKDHGDMSDIIGTRVARDTAAGTITLDQSKCVHELL